MSTSLACGGRVNGVRTGWRPYSARLGLGTFRLRIRPAPTQQAGSNREWQRSPPTGDQRHGADRRTTRRRDRRHRCSGHQGLGVAEGRQVLLAHLLPDDQHHRREARPVHRHQRRRQCDHRVHGEPADHGRARRLIVPQRQPAHDQRRSRLHRLGIQPARRT